MVVRVIAVRMSYSIRKYRCQRFPWPAVSGSGVLWMERMTSGLRSFVGTVQGTAGERAWQKRST